MLSALAALCLTSCNNDDEVSVNDGAVRFTASIGKEAVATPQSRAAGTAWHAGDEIGIFMVNHGTTDIAEGAENRQYTTGNGTGAFTAVMNNEIFYPMNNGTAVDFIAYYPHADGAKLSTDLKVKIAADQTDETQRATDLMWAKADNSDTGYTKGANKKVEFTFGHCLSKLTMNCTVDFSVGDPSLLADATVTIKGMNTSNTFDLKTGMLSGIPGIPEEITPRKLATSTGFHGSYDAIILPGSYNNGVLTVEFTLDGELFICDVEAITFEPGHEYIYKVKITRTGITVTGTIAPWTPVVKDDEVTAE